MTPVPVTSLYAALLALVFVALTIRVIGQRRASGVVLGVRGSPVLERAARVHANFAEHVPIALILLLLAELQGHPRAILHAAGIVLVVGRIAHAIGVSRVDENFRFRVAGVGATLGTMITLSLLILGRLLLGHPGV